MSLETNRNTNIEKNATLMRVITSEVEDVIYIRKVIIDKTS